MAHERFAHTPQVDETRLLRDLIEGVTCFFDHQPSRIEPDLLYSLGRRLPRFSAEGAAELTGRESGYIRQFIHVRGLERCAFA